MGYARPKSEGDTSPQWRIPPKEDRDMRLCFWMGFWFEPLGLIVAAIIAKADGVRIALRGMMWGCLLWLAIFIGLYLYERHEQKRYRHYYASLIEQLD